MTTKPYHEKPKFDYVELGLLKHAVDMAMISIAIELAEQDDKYVQTRLKARRKSYLEINYKLVEKLDGQMDSK